MGQNVVEIHALSKQFPSDKHPALTDISATIPRGKLVGIVGPDASGKTTLLRLIAGLFTPTSGTISVEGKDTMKDAEAIHFLTGYMPQKFGLYEDLTVYQNLNLYAELRNVVGEKKEEVFEQLLAFTDLKRFTGRLAKHLSGGMKQKLGLACALIKKPALLLLDEPSVGVDPVSRRELWKMVTSLVDEGISVLWSTAYLDEAEQCDSVLLLNEGNLLFEGDPKLLTAKMTDRVFAVSPGEADKRTLLFEFLKEPDVMDGVVQGDKLRIVMREGCLPPNGVSYEEVKPRFEDAFIDILGGGPGGESRLAERASVISNDGNSPIVAENLTKKFDSYTAVNEVCLEVKKGEIFGLLGPNGAGKTTIFKMLCGLLRPTSGKALVNHYDLQKAPDIARLSIGYMAQKFSLYGNLSVKQNLEFFAGVYRLENHAKKIAIQEMVEIFNLEKYFSTSTEMLPLGYKQRLSLACANMHQPKILFLDEPTSGVDPITRREFWNHINGLVQKGVTIMITTHFMEEAEYCDRIALIFRGDIIRMAPPTDLKEEVRSDENPNPTLEDAFVHLIENHGKES